MEPTNGEIIFWVVCTILAFAFLIFCALRAPERVDVDWKKIERWEKRG